MGGWGKRVSCNLKWIRGGLIEKLTFEESFEGGEVVVICSLSRLISHIAPFVIYKV